MPRKTGPETEENAVLHEGTEETVNTVDNLPQEMTDETASGFSEEVTESIADEESDSDPEDSSDVDEGYDVQFVNDEPAAELTAASGTAAPERPQRPRRGNLARAEERERRQALSQAQIANESALISAIHTQRIFTDRVAAVEQDV